MEIHMFEDRCDFWATGATCWHSRALYQIEYQMDRLAEQEAYQAAYLLWSDVAELVVSGASRLLVLEALEDCTATSVPGLAAAAASAYDWISDLDD